MISLDNKGNASIILCILITAIFGFTAFAVDIGIIYVEKSKLSNAIDSAALAAVMELPNDDLKAKNVALDYLHKNNVSDNEITINISTDHKSIEIDANRNVKHLFAPIIGINSSDVKVNTKAIVAPAKSISDGIRPFAVQKFNFTYGDLVTLKDGAGDGYNGNYGAIDLGGSGASIFRNNSLFGYNGTISVGDYIKTETGDMSGVTSDIKNYINSESSSFDSFPRDSIRLWTIPLVDTLQVNGKGEVQIVGFAEFYIEDAVKKSGHTELNGRFVKYVVNSKVDLNLDDTGAYGARLSR